MNVESKEIIMLSVQLLQLSSNNWCVVIRKWPMPGTSYGTKIVVTCPIPSCNQIHYRADIADLVASPSL